MMMTFISIHSSDTWLLPTPPPCFVCFCMPGYTAPRHVCAADKACFTPCFTLLTTYLGARALGRWLVPWAGAGRAGGQPGTGTNCILANERIQAPPWILLNAVPRIESIAQNARVG